MSEGDIDAMLERMAREEEDDINRKQGQLLLNIYDARRSAEHPLVDALRRAYEAKAEEE
jgi:D-lyxose ketol-isomerase